LTAVGLLTRIAGLIGYPLLEVKSRMNGLMGRYMKNEQL